MIFFTQKSISTYAEFTAQATIGSTIYILGQSGTVRSLSVVADPSGTKSIRFPVTWPSSSFSSNNQNITYNFSMSTTDYDILVDIDYIFTNSNIGVHPISGSSEANFDFYSLTFDGRQFFNTSGSTSNNYFKISFDGVINNNSGFVRFTTDSSVNGGNGLTGASGFFYLT